MRPFPYAHRLTIIERHKTKEIPVRREKAGALQMLWTHDAWAAEQPADYVIGEDGKLRHGGAVVTKWTLERIRKSGPSGKSTPHSKRDGARIELHLPKLTLDMIDHVRGTMTRADWIRGMIANAIVGSVATK